MSSPVITASTSGTASRSLLSIVTPVQAITAGVVLALAMVLGGLIPMWVARIDALHAAQAELGYVAALTAAHAGRIFRSTDRTIESAASEAAATPGAMGDPLLLQQILKRNVGASPQFRALYATDASGRVIATTAEQMPTLRDWSTLDAFTVQRDQPRQGFYVSASAQALRPEAPPTSLRSRRIDDPDGRFLGIVAADVNPSIYESLYRSLKLQEGSRVMLLTQAGTVLATYPVQANLTGRRLDLPAIDQTDNPQWMEPFNEGHGSAPNALYAIEPVEGYPIAVAVSFTEQRVYAGWQRHALWLGGGGVGAALAVMLLTLTFARHLRHERELDRSLRASEAGYRAIFSQRACGVVKVRLPEAAYVEVNDRFCEMLGRTREEILQCTVYDLVHPDDREAVRARFAHTDEGTWQAQTFEIRYPRRDGSMLYAIAGAELIHDPVDGHMYRTAVIQDVSALRVAHTRTVEQEARLAGIVQTAMDAIITVDSGHRIRLFNRAAEQIFGYRAEELIGQPLDVLLPPDARQAHRGHVDRFTHAGATSRRMGYGPVLRGVRRGGETFPIDASISRVEIGRERYLTVILRDISARMRSEEELTRARDELRQMSIASQAAREEEKSRISRELHDELGQSLTALKIDLGWMEARLPAEDRKLLEHVKAMQAMVDSTVAATRRIAADLRPLMLDDLGLTAALEWLARDFEKRNGITVKLDCRIGENDVDPRVATALYRTAQEALTNVARHAAATEVDVTLGVEGTTAHLTVHDNGRGFTDEERKKRKSFGLLGIRERVYILGGSVSISSQPGSGTTIQVYVPCTPTVLQSSPTSEAA